MADRYVKLDDVISIIKDVNWNLGGLIQHLKEHCPTADVVPKSEVEKLQAQNADLDILVKDLRFRNKELQKANEGLAKNIEELEIENDTVRGAYLDFEETTGLKQAKADVAREIFEEIDKLAKEGGVIWTHYAAAVLAELKKKYTEEQV